MSKDSIVVFDEAHNIGASPRAWVTWPAAAVSPLSRTDGDVISTE